MTKQKDQDNAAYIEIEMIVTKADVGADGRTRWQAVTSDTGKDLAGDNTTVALFNDWIERVEKSISVDWLPEPRVPFLGISHYPSEDGFGEAGPTEKMYVDGDRFKACGSFYDDSPVGKALYAALNSECAAVKRGEAIDEPMRISAAWWDIQHAHGKYVFTRESLSDRCPMCEAGAGNVGKTYLKGQVDHWAVTRVPMNERTNLAIEEKSNMAKKTRKDDAASIVGEELAEKLEENAQMVGKSETEATEAMVIKADEVDAVPVETDEVEPVKKAKATKAKAKKADVEKSDEGMMERPFGGATDLETARQWIDEQNQLNTTYEYWNMFDIVMMNIIEAEEGDKIEMMKKAISDFGAQVAAIKAGLSDASLVALTNSKLEKRSDTDMADEQNLPEKDQEVLEPVKAEAQEVDAYSQLKEGVEAALQSAGSREDKSNAIQEAFGQFAAGVRGQLDSANPPDVEQLVSEAVAKSTAEIKGQLDLVLAKLNQAQPTAQPVQKSISHPAEALNPPQAKPRSISQISRASVGLPI